MKTHENHAFGELGSAIGKGLLAGLAATAAMTVSQMIEMKFTKRKPSEATLKVAGEVTGIKPKSKKDKSKLSQEIHWTYGTVWGVTRGLIALTGLKGVPATLLHFGAVWGTSTVMLPTFKASPPVYEEEPVTIAIDGLHHAVYAITAGLVYDALDAGKKQERKLDQLVKQLKLKGLINRVKF